MTDSLPIIRPNSNGTPAVRGSRLNVFHIMDHYLAQRPREWVAEFYGIPVDDAAAAFEYIAAHEAELRPRYEQVRDENRRGNAPEIEARFEGARERLFRARDELQRRREEEAANARAAG